MGSIFSIAFIPSSMGAGYCTLNVETLPSRALSLSLSKPHLWVAMVGTTSRPVSSPNLSVSIVMPRSPDSSNILRATTTGEPISANWSVMRSPRLKFLASMTCTTPSNFSFTSMSLVTRSSSDVGMTEFIPGESISETDCPFMRAMPLDTSTVVPG